MAFCSSCGAQLAGDERFCVKCGADQTAKAAAPIPPPPYAAPLYPQGLPGQPPIILGAPPAQSKQNRWIWAVVIVAVLGAGYYYNEQHPQTPTQPGTAPGQGGNNAALASEQAFSGQATIVSGTVQITNARWTNHSNVAIQSATLECVVYDANGTTLGQMPFTLSGPNNAPVQPGATINFNTIQSSTGTTNASSVNCSIEGVSPAN